MQIYKKTAHALLFAAVMAIPSAALAEKGPVLLTIAGEGVEANRPAFDENTDVVFGYLGAEFDAAHAFDHAALAGLDQTEVVTPFPVTGGEEARFHGPSLAALMAAVGVEVGDQMIRLTAMDGYTVEQSLADMIDWGGILATHKDGAPMGLGDFGPTMVVFPPSETVTPATANADLWVWSVIYAEVAPAAD